MGYGGDRKLDKFSAKDKPPDIRCSGVGMSADIAWKGGNWTRIIMSLLVPILIDSDSDFSDKDEEADRER